MYVSKTCKFNTICNTQTTDDSLYFYNKLHERKQCYLKHNIKQKKSFSISTKNKRKPTQEAYPVSANHSLKYYIIKY